MMKILKNIKIIGNPFTRIFLIERYLCEKILVTSKNCRANVAKFRSFLKKYVRSYMVATCSNDQVGLIARTGHAI